MITKGISRRDTFAIVRASRTSIELSFPLSHRTLLQAFRHDARGAVAGWEVQPGRSSLCHLYWQHRLPTRGRGARPCTPRQPTAIGRKTWIAGPSPATRSEKATTVAELAA